MVQLTDYTRYRIEDSHVLLCNCFTLQLYRFPMECLCILDQLKIGIEDTTELSQLALDLIDDLTKIQCIKLQSIQNMNIVWNKLGYTDGEFVK
jgi:hypothetical protein